MSDPLDLTIIAACAAVACFGFLWYNSNPASIFMGDTGSLALGGLFAAMSIATHTEFLAIILGGLFVIETMSDIIQVGYFKMTHKRVFKMAPIHHHFELKGWPEVKVVVRFWMIEMLFVLIAWCCSTAIGWPVPACDTIAGAALRPQYECAITANDVSD